MSLLLKFKMVQLVGVIVAVISVQVRARSVTSYISSIKNSIIESIYPPPTSQQQLHTYAVKVSKDFSFGYHDAEVISDMKLVGMKEMRAVTAFTVKKSMLPGKMRAELSAKRMPIDVADAIVEGIAGVSKYTNSFEDFLVDRDGTGKIFKATVMMKPDPDDDESSEVAMAVSGALFNAATEVEAYEEEEVPDYKEVEEIETMIETGLLGDYKVPKTVKKIKVMGTKKKKTPIFKQKTFTNAKLESIKKFLEGKTLGEVKLLYGPSRDEA